MNTNLLQYPWDCWDLLSWSVTVRLWEKPSYVQQCISHPSSMLSSFDQRRSIYQMVAEMFDDTGISDSSTTRNRWEPTGGKTSFEQGPEHFCLYWFRLRRFQSKQMPPSTYRLFESFSFVTNNVIQTKPPSGKWLVSFFENQHCSKWPVPKLRFSWTRHC